MPLTKQKLQKRLADLLAGKETLLGQLNAQLGAIRLTEELIAELDGEESKPKEKSP